MTNTPEMEIVTPEEFDAEWAAELNRRVAESQSGLDVLIPAEEVHRMAREAIQHVESKR